MRTPTLLWLLGLWVVLALAPGVIVAAAYSLDANSAVNGGPVLIWLLGYLVQFAVFLLVTRRSRGASAFAWVVAAVLPWVCDWTVPVAQWALAPCAAVGLGVSWWITRRTTTHDDLMEHGVPAVGEVLEVVRPRLANVVINNAYIKRTLRLRVDRNDGTPTYEVGYHGTFLLGDIPEPGARLSLRVDPKNPKHFTTVDDDSARQTALDG